MSSFSSSKKQLRYQIGWDQQIKHNEKQVRSIQRGENFRETSELKRIKTSKNQLS